MYDSIQTPTDLDALPTPVLVDMYNKLTGKSIKGFHTRSKGVEQTFRALQGNRDGKATTKAEATVKPPKAKKAKAPKKVNRRRPGRAGRLDLDATIEVLIEVNPKRPNTMGHFQFDMIMACDGMTVREFIKHAESAEYDREHWVRSELLHCEKKGFIATVSKVDFREENA